MGDGERGDPGSAAGPVSPASVPGSRLGVIVPGIVVGIALIPVLTLSLRFGLALTSSAVAAAPQTQSVGSTRHSCPPGAIAGAPTTADGGGADDGRARRPAVRRRDAGNFPLGVAARPDPAGRDRRRDPLRLQHRRPGSATRTHGDVATGRARGGAPAAADRYRPGGRRRAPPPVGRAVRVRRRARPARADANPGRGGRVRPGASASGRERGSRPRRRRPCRGIVHGPRAAHVRHEPTVGQRRRGGVRRRARLGTDRGGGEALPRDRPRHPQHRPVGRRDRLHAGAALPDRSRPVPRPPSGPALRS